MDLEWHTEDHTLASVLKKYQHAYTDMQCAQRHSIKNTAKAPHYANTEGGRLELGSSTCNKCNLELVVCTHMF